MAILRRSIYLTKGGLTHVVAGVAIAATAFVIIVDDGNGHVEGKDYISELMT